VEERHAAVALILRDLESTGQPAFGRSGSELLLIRRALHERDPWSGHMALPGGRRDPSDVTLLDTVNRETLEEVGVDLSREAELVGCLPALPAMARGRILGMTITPFVFAVSEDPRLSLNYEVAEVLWAPLGLLSGGSVNTTVTYEGAQQVMHLPGWDLEGRIVWGLTHRMVSMLLEIVRSPDRLPPQPR
jgi:8-oxo-dGTP pyrophosphatase MutT (NUDIX family)